MTMLSRSAALPALLTLPLLAACGAAGDSNSPVVRDSAGIAVVDYATRFATTADRRWSADAEPVFTIGGADLPLDGVIGPVMQSSGAFVAGNAGFHELLFFDSAGRLLARSGGSGGGPGEFSHLMLLSTGPGDSIVAYDSGDRRASIFGQTGAFARTVSMPRIPGMIGVEYAGLLRDGRMVVAVHRRIEGDGLARDSLAVLAFSPGSDSVAALATYPHTWMDWGPHRMPGGGDRLVKLPLPVPLSSQTAVAARGDSIYIATADRFSLTLLTPDGVLRITHEAQTPGPITDADREALFTHLAALGNPETDLFRGLRGPETLPAFGSGPLTMRVGDVPLVITDDGGVWLEPFSVGDSIDTRWPRFDAGGVYEGIVVVPDGFRPTAVRGDLMLGVYRDSSDVEYLRAYRFSEDDGAS